MIATKLSRITLRALHWAGPALVLGWPLVACNKDVTFTGNSADKAQPKIVVDQEFPAAKIGSESLTVDPGYGTVTQTLALYDKPPVTMALKQMERGIVEEPFTQGRDGSMADEPFEVSAIGKLDLLVVVDNSGSMSNKQAKLKSELGSLTSKLTRVDWQIAVITTDSSCLRNKVIIKKDDPAAEKLFNDAIDAGTNGSGDERGIHYAIKAIEGRCLDRNDVEGTPFKFLRDDASFGLLVLSDENSYCGADATDDSKCQPGERPQDLIDAMTKLKVEKTLVRAYALLWDDTDNKCKAPGDSTDGKRYRDVVKAVGGIAGSLCANDYSSQLNAISADVGRSVKSQLALKFEPDARSIAITMIDDEGKSRLYSDFVITGKSIKLGKIEDKDRKIVVVYRYDSKPKFDRFHLSGKPVLASLMALVNGEKIDAAKLSFDDQNGEVVFADLPPDNATVTVKFRKGDEVLRKQFDTPWADMDGAPVAVAVDGQATAAAFDAAAKTITFADPPPDGAEIKVSYKVVGGLQTVYAAQLRTDALLRHDIQANDAATGAPVPVTLDGDKLVFDPADVANGRAVDVRYDYGDRGDTLTHELANEPLEGSLVVEALGSDGASCVDHLVQAGKTVSFGCASETMGAVGITYKFVAEAYNRFDVAGVPAGSVHWQVYVDGASVPYDREGNTVVISPSLLKFDSKVRVVLTVLQ